MGKPTYNREVIEGSNLTCRIHDGMDTLYAVAVAAYGVQSGNVMLEHRADAPTISHDGVTNLDALEVSDPVEDMTIQVVKQASKRTNDTAGDGTTLSAILSYHLYEWAGEQEENGKSLAEISRTIDRNARNILSIIDDITVGDISDAQLRGVCEISAGDPDMGALVYDVIKQVGRFGGVNTIYTGANAVYPDVIDGMFLDRSGYLSAVLRNDIAGNKSVLTDVPVVILGSTYDRAEQIVPILEKLVTCNFHNALFVGDITGDALHKLETIPKSTFDVMAIKPDPTNYQITLENVAMFTGGEIFNGKPQEWDVTKHAGHLDTATVTNAGSTLIGHDGGERLEKFIEELKGMLVGATPAERTTIESRIACLQAKVANIYVGSASEVERKERKLRIDDAICAAKSALSGGIVPGGGVCLRNIGYALDLPYLVRPYADLLMVSHIGDYEFDYDHRENVYNELWRGGAMPLPNSGYNLRSGELVEDMVEACIVDPAIVIREAVRNSHSVISKLITTQVALPFEDRKWEF